MQPLGKTPRHIPLLTILLATLLARCHAPPPPPATQPTSATQPASAPASTQPALDRSIRVLLLRDLPECTVSINEPFDIVDAARGKTLDAVHCPDPLTISLAEGVVRLVEMQRAFDADVIDLRPHNNGRIAICTPGGVRHYRGWLRFVPGSPDGALVLNVVDIEDYLLGVVTAEMPADFRPAALCAQAVASRTFAWYNKRFYGPHRGWDVQAEEGSQVYSGMGAETGAAVRAVQATSGIVCTYSSPVGERIFPAYFSSTCGGVTRVADQRKGEPKFPVLAGDVLCDFCASSSFFRWGPVTISKKQVTQHLRKRFDRIAEMGPITNVEITRRTARGRPMWVEVYDASGRREGLDIESFRLGVDPGGRVLKSGYFSLLVQRDSVVFTVGRGLGHGQGMCQVGANTLAKTGKSAAEILRFYYPGCHLVRAY